MFRTFLAALAALCVAGTAQAAPKTDPERSAILATVDAFFAAMGHQDAKTLADLTFADGGVTYQSIAADGSAQLTRAPMPQVIEGMAKRAGLDEHIWSPTVQRRGPMAVVWAPYEFKLEGKTTHCGIDVFDLVKTEGRWKVAHLMWTREPGACAELGRK